MARASLDPCFASCIFWDTVTARDAETARDTQAALNTRQARDTEMDRKVGNEFTPENLYICMDHGPMVVDRVLVRDLVDTHIEYKHERDYVEVSYCRRCHLEQEDKKRSEASEDENDKGQEHQKEKEEPCRHLVQTVRGGNQYGSWSKCLDCGKVLNYQKHGATSNKGEKGSTFEKKVNDKRSDPKGHQRDHAGFIRTNVIEDDDGLGICDGGGANTSAGHLPQAAGAQARDRRGYPERPRRGISAHHRSEG